MKTLRFTLREGESHIPLIQLLKAANCVDSGSDAQAAVVSGMVRRNGEVELRKRAKCVAGDIIEFADFRIEIAANPPAV